jgi:AraC family transcriptional regulator
LAALELQNSDIKVIDVAIKYGYESPISFSRAFQALHGVTPSEVRNDGVTLKAYPKMSFQISIKGEKEMDYRIETKEAFQIFGIEKICNDDETKVYASVDGINISFMEDQWESAEFEKLEADAGNLPSFVNEKLSKTHTVFCHKETNAGTFSTMLFAFRSPTSKTEGYTVADIPAHTWAIFQSDIRPISELGNDVAVMYKRIYSEWIPSSGYELASDLEMELCGGGEHSFIEIWLPVKKK